MEDKSSAGSKEKILDLAVLDEIFQTMVKTVEDTKDDIYSIAEEARLEFVRLGLEFQWLKDQTLKTIAQVEACEQKEKNSRRRLADVSRNFALYSEADIKEAYENTRNLQVELSRLREKEKNLIARRDEVERSLRRIEHIAVQAEGLVERINLVIKMLKSNAEDIADRIDDLNRRRDLGIWLLQVQEEERKKIARELHDGPAQSLIGIMMHIEAVEKLWERDRDRVLEEINLLKHMAKTNLDEIRRIIFDLRPAPLEEKGLVGALAAYLDDYQEKYSIKTTLILHGRERPLPLPLETAIYRLVQESLSNVYKHARVDEATVKMEYGSKRLLLVVSDRGAGFDVNAVGQDKFGLLGMKERVEILGGKFQVKSKPQAGTSIIISFPLEKEEEKCSGS